MPLLHLLAHVGTALLAIIAITLSGIILITNVIRIDYETAGRRSFVTAIALTALLLLPVYISDNAGTALSVDATVALASVALFTGVWLYVRRRKNKS